MKPETRRRLSQLKWIAPCLALLIGACASPGGQIVLLDGEDGAASGAIVVTNEQGSRTLDEPGKSLGLAEDEDVPAEPVEQSEIEEDFARVLAAHPQKPRRFLIYFEFGTTRLTKESEALIPEIIAEVGRRAAPDIGVIGHTDTAGDADVNAALALERAKSIRDLVVFAGAFPDLIEVTSHGEENLLVLTADGVSEPKNRRVEVIIR